MSERAEELARQFEEAHQALVTWVDGCTDEQWRAICPDEGWTVAATAHHVAAWYALIAGRIRAVVEGQSIPPLAPSEVDRMNAEHAQRFAGVGKPETLELLQRNAAAAADLVRGLTDAQLQRSSRSLTVEQIVEMVLIGHPRQHLASIRAAVGA